MRRTMTLLTASLAIGLLALPGAALAQDAEADYARPTEVTGSFTSGECDSPPGWRGVGNQDELPGASTFWICEGESDSSDPRLAGASLFREDGQWFRLNGLDESERMLAGCEADEDCSSPVLGLWHAARLIENENGAWRQRPFVQIDSSATDYVAQNPHVHVFDGEGDYAGLIAVLEVTGQEAYDFSDTAHEYWGYVLDARQLLDAPETASAH